MNPIIKDAIADPLTALVLANDPIKRWNDSELIRWESYTCFAILQKQLPNMLYSMKHAQKSCLVYDMEL